MLRVVNKNDKSHRQIFRLRTLLQKYNIFQIHNLMTLEVGQDLETCKGPRFAQFFTLRLFKGTKVKNESS